MTLLKYIKELKNFSVIFIPEDTAHKARSIKFTLPNLLLIGILYTFIVGVFGFYTLSLTGLDYYFLPSNAGLRQEDRRKVEEINTKMIFLVRELEKLKATNERLKYALILGDSTMFETLDQPQDTIKKGNRLPAEGNILMIVYKLLFDESIQDESFLLIKPINGFLSRKFDSDKGHMGIDFAVKEGTPVYASAGGYVIFSDYTVNDGYMIILNHLNGFISVYKHCASLIKSARETVEQGELIALSGNTGRKTTGPHLHFEIWKNGKPVDPEKHFINY
jgi:murein DD-endopeptidase MepM/ murein hydrolase activator NlpD